MKRSHWKDMRILFIQWKCWRVSLKSCQETKVLVSREQGQFPEESICLGPGAWPCPHSIHTAGPAPTRSTLPVPLSVGADHAVPNSLHHHCFQESSLNSLLSLQLSLQLQSPWQTPRNPGGQIQYAYTLVLSSGKWVRWYHIHLIMSWLSGLN